MIIDCHGTTARLRGAAEIPDASSRDSKTGAHANGGEAEHQRRPDPREPREGQLNCNASAARISHLFAASLAMAHHVGTNLRA